MAMPWLHPVAWAILFLTGGSLHAAPADGPDYPAERWPTRTPREAGLDEPKLHAARDYALTGDGAGMIVHRGSVVLAWGDTKKRFDLKSTTKSIGAYGDGWGFEPKLPKKLSLGLARIDGSPEDTLAPENLRSPTIEQTGDGSRGGKASGLLMVDGVLYMWVRNTGNARLAWSADHGKSWTWADWKLETGFGCPTFVNYGRNYQGAADDFVYTFSPDAYTPADRMVLARVPKDRIRDRDAYEFFERLDGTGKARWTRDVARRGAVYERKGRCYRSGVTWNAPLKRYLWTMTLPDKQTRRLYGLTVFEAPHPWGPWAVVQEANPWDVDAGDSACIPAKWISPDGRSGYLVFAGNDRFSVRRFEFRVHSSEVRMKATRSLDRLNSEL